MKARLSLAALVWLLVACGGGAAPSSPGTSPAPIASPASPPATAPQASPTPKDTCVGYCY